ncbi:MAG: ABC transporter permease [Verrucomicrobiia bacterium]|jgi:sodium transport system permease protein
MLSRSLSYVVFRKELRETLRDKRVLLGVIISPLLVTPLILGTAAFFVGKKVTNQSAAVLDIGIVEHGAFPDLIEKLEDDDSIKTQKFETRKAAIEAIDKRTVRSVLVVSENAQQNFQSDQSASLEIIYNLANENSQNANSRLQNIIQKFSLNALSERVQAKALPDSFTKPIDIKNTNIASSDSTGAFILGMILPYIIVISAAFGGIQTAFDICAGEKERSTMETLLVSPASRPQIVLGKLFTIFAISLLASICAMTGVLAPLVIGLDSFKDILGDQISINLSSIPAMLLIVVPLALFTSSLLLVISSFARNQKEAQTYVLPFISIILLPAMLSTIFGAETQLYTAFIPVMNISLTMKQILGDLFDPLYFAISLGSSFLYAYIVMRIATAFFQRENILFRT